MQMQIISNPDSRIIKILGRNSVEAGRDYRLSAYVYCYSDSGRHLIKSTMTGGVYSLSDEEWAVIDPAVNPVVPGSVFEESGLSEFVKACVMVYSEDDDYSRYKLAVSVLKAMDKRSGIKNYTILPTTGCNARCVYCYEKGMKISTMTEATADKVVDYILRTKASEELTLRWFGGEPLVANKIITGICTALNEHNVPFKSRLVTNASLFTPELMDTAVNVWHLKSAQVSVDGSKADYESRKLFCCPSFHNYEHLLKTIGLMLEAGLEVTLRCNYDQANVDGMYEFWGDINELYGSYEKLSVYSAMLFQAKDDESCIELHKRYLELRADGVKRGFKFLKSPNTEYRMKTNFCMADSDGRCAVISPEGDLYHCEHLPTNTACSNISDDDFKLGSDPRAFLEADEKCRNCCFLPECTPFFRNGCPDRFEYCREFKSVDTESQLKSLM